MVGLSSFWTVHILVVAPGRFAQFPPLFTSKKKSLDFVQPVGRSNQVSGWVPVPLECATGWLENPSSPIASISLILETTQNRTNMIPYSCPLPNTSPFSLIFSF